MPAGYLNAKRIWVHMKSLKLLTWNCSSAQELDGD